MALAAASCMGQVERVDHCWGRLPKNRWVGVGEERCRQVVACGRYCENTLDRLEVVSAPKQAVVCVCVEHRALGVLFKFLASSGVRSSSHESLRPRDEDGTHVLESSVVDLAQWVKGAWFTGCKGPDVSSALQNVALLMCCWTASSHHEREMRRRRCAWCARGAR